MRKLIPIYSSIVILFFLLSVNTYSQSTVLKLPTVFDSNSSFDINDNENTNLFRVNSSGGFFIKGLHFGFKLNPPPIEGAGGRLMWYPDVSAFRSGYVSGNQWNSDFIGNHSIALGYNTMASGNSSVAIGYETSATGSGSIALGSYGHASRLGSFVFSDASTIAMTDTLRPSANNQMVMRFAGGYSLFTAANLTIGASLNANANSWSTISDSSKKENFVKANGESFLNSLSELKLGSWNYKAQDKNIRHYGPMAQEVFHYFGKDELGIIGNDTTIATADIDGIIMICLQALEKRTSELKKAEDKISQLEKQLNDLVEKIDVLAEKLPAENEEREFVLSNYLKEE